MTIFYCILKAKQEAYHDPTVVHTNTTSFGTKRQGLGSRYKVYSLLPEPRKLLWFTCIIHRPTIIVTASCIFVGSGMWLVQLMQTCADPQVRYIAKYMISLTSSTIHGLTTENDTCLKYQRMMSRTYIYTYAYTITDNTLQFLLL